MYYFVVSSKTMARPKPREEVLTFPELLEESQVLMRSVRKLNERQLGRLMHISPKLAITTWELLSTWENDHTHGTAAIDTFVGDVYKGLKAHLLDREDIEFASEHFRILSGLYGILRPLDKIHPYRLEMGYSVPISGKKRRVDQYWKHQVAETLQDRLICDLASEEYMRVIKPYVEPEQIIKPKFIQIVRGEPVFQTIHAKIARGTMSRWAIKHRITEAEDLKKFDYDRYRYDAASSLPHSPVFIREVQ